MRKTCDNCHFADWDVVRDGSDEFIRICTHPTYQPEEVEGDCEGWKCGKTLTPDESIYVIDLETTGLDGQPNDSVVEVGIAEYNQWTGKVTPVYSAIVHVPDIREIDKAKINPDGSRGCWVFNNTSLTIDEVEGSKNELSDVAREVRNLLRGKFVTCYNISFDFAKFLDYSPWDLYRVSYPARDIMDIATKCLRNMADRDGIKDKQLQKRLIDDWEKKPNGWVCSQDAYNGICPDDPAQLNGKQTHRALDDAIMEGWILSRAIRYLALDKIFGFVSSAIKTMNGVYDALIKGESRP